MTKKLRSKGLEEGKQWWGLTARKREGKGEVDLTGSEGLHRGAGGNGRLWGSQGSWTTFTEVSGQDNATETKSPLQGPHSLSHVTVRMDRRVWPFLQAPGSPEGLPDLCEATGGSFSSESVEMSPQLHQLGVQNCL